MLEKDGLVCLLKCSRRPIMRNSVFERFNLSRLTVIQVDILKKGENQISYSHSATHFLILFRSLPLYRRNTTVRVFLSSLPSRWEVNHLCNTITKISTWMTVNHSTKTALLTIHSQRINSVDRGKVTALILIDLSAAFDTFDHKVGHRFEDWSGLPGPALSWFASYTQSPCTQSIRINSVPTVFKLLP